MIHTFKLGDVHAVLDVNSGSVHMVDEVVYDILNKQAEGKYGEEEIWEAAAEIEELKQEGILDSPAAMDNYRPEFNKPVVKAMCLHVAHDCNLRCKYCFANTGDYEGNRELMPLETAKHALLFLVQNSGNRRNLEVDFFGGEPLLNFNVVRGAVEYGRELEKQYNKNIRFTMTTNAYHMTDEMAGFINTEMKNLVISIDGRREVHDAMRPNAVGAGSYEKVLKNARKLIGGRDGREYYIRGTYTNRNTDFSRDVMAIADAGFDQVSVEPVVDGGALAISEADLPQIFSEYEKLADLYLERKRQGNPFHFFHFMIDLESGPCLNKRLRGCGAGSEYIAVTPNGDMYPCHQFAGVREFYMGSVLENTKNEEIGRRFTECHVFSKEKCTDCWAKYYCSGGCFADAYFTNNDIAIPNRLSCEIEKKRVETAIALKILAAEEGIKNRI